MKERKSKNVLYCIIFLFIVVNCCFLSCGCENKTEVLKVSEIMIDTKNIYMIIGEKAVVGAQVFPFNAENQMVVWKSSNNNVASVSEGVVTGVSSGTAVIYAVSEDGNFTDDCNVLVVSSINSLSLTNFENMNAYKEHYKNL